MLVHQPVQFLAMDTTVSCFATSSALLQGIGLFQAMSTERRRLLDVILLTHVPVFDFLIIWEISSWAFVMCFNKSKVLRFIDSSDKLWNQIIWKEMKISTSLLHFWVFIDISKKSVHFCVSLKKTFSEFTWHVTDERENISSLTHSVIIFSITNWANAM